MKDNTLININKINTLYTLIENYGGLDPKDFIVAGGYCRDTLLSTTPPKDMDIFYNVNNVDPFQLELFLESLSPSGFRILGAGEGEENNEYEENLDGNTLEHVYECYSPSILDRHSGGLFPRFLPLQFIGFDLGDKEFNGSNLVDNFDLYICQAWFDREDNNFFFTDDFFIDKQDKVVRVKPSFEDEVKSHVRCLRIAKKLEFEPILMAAGENDLEKAAAQFKAYNLADAKAARLAEFNKIYNELNERIARYEGEAPF